MTRSVRTGRHRAPATIREATDGLRAVLELVALAASTLAHLAVATAVAVALWLALPWVG